MNRTIRLLNLAERLQIGVDKKNLPVNMHMLVKYHIKRDSPLEVKFQRTVAL